jgi:two-component system LytT family response regulator
MEAIRTLIVDDEPAARRGLRLYLQAHPEAEVVGEARHGREAVELIPRLAPDLVYLDVQMPEMGGFDVIAAVGAARMPAVIFVTAYDRYALQAFDVHALDYLLKPVDRARFHEAFHRAVRMIRHDRADRVGARLEAALRSIEQRQRPEAPPPQERFVVKEAGRIFFVYARDVDWIEAAGNYVALHAGPRTHLLRETMQQLEERLDGRVFIRISRSCIVNTARVREFHPLYRGSYDLLLEDGTTLTSSRHFRANVEAFYEASS